MPGREFQLESIGASRLIMRRCQLSDAPELKRLMTPAISKCVASWPSPLSLDDCRAILSANLDAAVEGRVFPAVILARDRCEIIGWLRIEISYPPSNSAELGYWIGEAYQRRGYAFEAARAAIDFAFSKLHVEAVIAGAQIANGASHKLLHKIGMSDDGERDVWAPARMRRERCRFWKLLRHNWQFSGTLFD